MDDDEGPQTPIKRSQFAPTAVTAAGSCPGRQARHAPTCQLDVSTQLPRCRCENGATEKKIGAKNDESNVIITTNVWSQPGLH